MEQTRIQTPNQNLIEQVRVDEESLPRGFYQILTIDAFAVLSSLALGYTYLRFAEGTMGFWLVVLSFGIFGILSVLGLLFRKTRLWRFVLLVLEAAAFSAFWYKVSFSLVITAFFILFFYFAWGERDGRSELDNCLEIKFFRAARFKMNKVVTGTILAMVLLYLPQWSEGPLIGKASFDSFFAMGSGTVTNIFYPNVDLNASANAFAESVAQKKLEESPAYNELPSDQKLQAVQSASATVLKNLSVMAGNPIEPQTPMSDVFYSFIKNFLSTWREKLGSTFIVLWSVFVFLVARSIAVVFSFLGTLVAFLVYELFLALDVIRVSGEGASHEVIEFT